MALSALVLLGSLGSAPAMAVPAGVRMLVSERSIAATAEGSELARTELCAGFRFDQLGLGGPRFSPDRHWVLVDVLGPFEPGNVPRVHAVIDVRTGGMVLGVNFQSYLGVATSTGTITWASGERAALRYPDQHTATLADPPLRPLPPTGCHV